MKGYKRGKFTDEHKRKLASLKWGEKNPQWKGDKASLEAGRDRAKRLFDAPEGLEIHHIDGNPLNNDSSNIEFLSRKEHMKKDGRLTLLQKYNEERRIKITDEEYLALYEQGLYDYQVALLYNCGTTVIQELRTRLGLLPNRFAKNKGEELNL